MLAFFLIMSSSLGHEGELLHCFMHESPRTIGIIRFLDEKSPLPGIGRCPKNVVDLISRVITTLLHNFLLGTQR